MIGCRESRREKIVREMMLASICKECIIMHYTSVNASAKKKEKIGKKRGRKIMDNRKERGKE